MGSGSMAAEHVVREQPVEEVLLGVGGVVSVALAADEALVHGLALGALDDGALLHLAAVRLMKVLVRILKSQALMLVPRSNLSKKR